MAQRHSSLPKATLRTYIGSTLFFIYILLSTPMIAVAISLALPAPFKWRYQFGVWWIDSLLAVVKITCGLSYEVEGLENIPSEGAVVALSKHQSAWETIAFRQFLPMQTTLLKQSLLWIPFGGWALASLKPIAIDRSNPKQALKMLIDQGTACLDEGLWVVTFPEGTRVAPGDAHKFNAGGAMLAVKSGYPVIPMAHNAGEFWPRNSFLKYSGVIKVKIGAVIPTTGKTVKEINSEVEAWIHQAMTEISQVPPAPRESSAK